MAAVYLSLFRERLRYAMGKRGWNQNRLASAMRQPASAISHWLCGRRLPDFENLRHLCVVLECDANWLICTGTLYPKAQGGQREG